MFGIKTVWNAMTGLASAIVELTSTVKQVNGTLRERLGLDVAEQDNPVVQLPEPEAAVSNGRRRKLTTASE
jgi:hypothetical protein